MRRLIVNADDYGFTKGVNKGIEKSAECGVLTSISAMANQPYVEDLSNFAKKFPHIGVGVHINLTQGKPLLPASKVRSLVNERGEFYPYSEFWRRSALGKINLREVYNETSAQIERITKLLGKKPDHADVHQYTVPPVVFPAFVAALKRNQINAVRSLRVLFVPNSVLWRAKFFAQNRRQILTFTYKSATHNMLKLLNFKTPDARLLLTSAQEVSKSVKQGWTELLTKLPEGTFEWILHPAIIDDELRKKSKILLQRMEELELLCSDTLRKTIKSANITLIRFSDL